MEKIVVELDVKSQKGVKEVEKLNKEISNTNKETADASKTLDGFTGGAVSKFKGLRGSIGGVVKGFKSLKFAILASGIGALLLAVVAVGKAFTSSEEGQNKFAKIMGVIGSVTGNLVDLLADLGEKIISVFENPKQAIIDLKDLIVENITNRFNSIIDTLGFLGSAFKKVFSGDFSGALEDAKKAGSSYVDSLTGVENSIDKVTEGVKKMSAETSKDAKAAANIADQRAKADKLDRKLITERAEANRKRAELLDKAAQKEKFTAKERIDFLTEAGKIEDDITAKEIKAAKLRYDSKVAENALSKSTKEDLDKEAELKANLINLETAKLTKQKLVSSQVVGAKREEAAEIKAIEDKAIADRKAIQELEANTEAEKRALALEKEKEKFDNAIALATEQGLSTEELERSQKESLQLMRDEFAQTDIDREKKVINEVEAANILKAQKEAEIEEARMAMRSKALDDIISIANAETAVGKAALVAKQLLMAKELILEIKKTITFSTQAAARSLVAVAEGTAQTAKIGFPQNIPMLIGYAAQAAGIYSAIKKATSKAKTTAPPSPNISSGSSSPSSAPSLPPSFNIVGASETSQLADSIGGQSKEPIKAFVVANDVSSAQEMDRNIIEGASL
jgi:hypothetical protein